MRFEDKLKNRSSMAIWQEYCGFLDLGIDDYMDIQNSLMKEQLQIWSDCPLGKEILKGKKINSIESEVSQTKHLPIIRFLLFISFRSPVT